MAVSPLAKGLIKRAVLLSGGVCITSWGPVSQEFSLNFTKATTKGVTLSQLKSMSIGLNQKTWTTWQNLEVQYSSLYKYHWPNLAYSRFSGYWVDGYVIPEMPYYSFQNKSKINVEQIILGGNSYDGGGIYIVKMFNVSENNYESVMNQWWKFKNRTKVKELIDKYSTTTKLTPNMNGWIQKVLKADSDFTVTCANMKLAQILKSHDIPAF